ncbi:aldehyde dehydrogenase family protein [Gordonia sp. HNM0687]|uniref:Aldehyde dehydrogenase family protein n=1 Tax=Gordonia mangrovi TaxID=2665643 RepID=A0A6L7GUZ3_9ACTN|nr:aldehyde dehydrogenase family protein [Gordonia mangrovi]MXP23393.1 aldehyde dehydrogenase family protein [Gordonia mangrovi]UVF76704.1 aldehyde dehydrogenase family protein [Gordonia mangrovi]
MTDSLALLIDGKLVEAADNATYESTSPVTGEVLATVASAGSEDVSRAVSAARRAFESWHRASYLERRRVLLAAADYLEQKAATSQAIMALEVGLPAPLTALNIQEGAATLREAAGLTSAPLGEILPSYDPQTSNLNMRVPAGVVLAIVPWNAPVILAARSTAIALAVGNSVIVKPSEESPNSAGHLLAEALSHAGAPDGLINVLSTAPERGPQVIEELLSHPYVRRVVFIGSTRTGRKIAALAGEHLVPAVMELGGKNSTIVLDDADLDAASDMLVHAAFTYGGQVCMATDRIIATDRIFDDLTERVLAKTSALRVGDPRDPANDYGPLINQRAAEGFRTLVSDAVNSGARILHGSGETDGLYAEPVVLTDLPTTARAFYEEAFSPVVSLQRASDEADAIRQANDTELGLMASVISGDDGHALSVANRIHSGAIHVNSSSIGDEPHVPFGGIGASGFGRLGGLESVRTFTEQRTIYLHGNQLAVPVVKE